jgi:serine/threonine-protein kinase
VADFSEDLRRYLENRPVLARQGNWTYRARKFVGRHKLAAVSSAVFSAALLVTIAGMGWQWHVARTERFRADARFEDVHQLARSFLFEFETAIERVPGSTEPRILLLKKTSEYLERLSRDVSGDEGVVLDIGEAYLRLGALQATAFESNTGDVKAAEASYRKSLAMELRLLERQPHHRQALDISARARLQLSDILSSMGRIRESVAEARQAAGTFSSIVSGDPKDQRALRDAGVAYLYLAGVVGGPDQLNMGDRKGAIEATRTAIAHYDRFIQAEPGGDVAKGNGPLARLMLAYLLSAEGAPRQATALLPEVEAALRNLRQLHPAAEMLADFDEGAARIWQRLEDHAAANSYLEEAVGLRRRAAQADPRDSNAQFALAAALYHYGLSQSALGHGAEGHANFETAAGILDALAKRDSNNLLWLSGLTDVLIEAGQEGRALALGRQLAERSEATPDEVIRYARLLRGPNPAASVAVARRATEMTSRSRWDIEDDFANTCAAAGEWKEAAGAEARALTLLEAYKPDSSASPYNRVLERFERYSSKARN